MIYPPDMLDILQSAAVSAWSGTVYRHMFGANLPTHANTHGARWNDTGLAAIYTSCERETALAEAEYYISLQPLRPRAKRALYTVRVTLKNVIDLTARRFSRSLGSAMPFSRVQTTHHVGRSQERSIGSGMTVC